MFYARIESAGEFKKLLEVLKETTPFINLNISNQGFSIEATESLFIVQAHVKIPKTYFSEFKIQGTHSLGVHIPDLITILKIGQSEDHLILEYVSSSNVIKVCLQASKTPTICEFTLNLMQVDSLEGLYRETLETGKFFMASKVLHSTFYDLSLISEYLGINLNKMRVKFAVNADAAGGSVHLKHIRGEGGVAVSTSRTVNVGINLIYAKKITRAHVLCDRVEVRVRENEPIVFIYNFEGVEVKFFLALTISDS